MPELPDVERNRVLVEDHVVGARIVGVTATDSTVLRNSTIPHANDMLHGRTIIAAERTGKWLRVRTDGPTVLVHFGMTGWLRWASAADPVERFDRLTFATDAGELRYNDMRKLRGIWLALDDRAASEIVGLQGPDALTMSLPSFAAISHRRGSIKAALMDQSVIAGLGNMLTDEILWRAGIRPTRLAAAVADAEYARLHKVMRSTLRTAVRAGRIPPNAYLLSSQRDREPPICPRCHRVLERSRIAGRTSLWCPHDQPA